MRISSELARVLRRCCATGLVFVLASAPGTSRADVDDAHGPDGASPVRSARSVGWERSTGPTEDAEASATTETQRRSKTAVQIGESVVTVGELEDRLAGIPPFQLATFGASREAIVKAYVEQVVVRDLLLAAGAKARGLARKQPTVFQLERARSSATLRAARKPLPSPVQIPEADIKAYYDTHRERFDAPERINLWRVLCKSEAEAKTVLDSARAEPTIEHFKELAREHSIDEATKFRGGNLGFLTPEGVSNQAGLKVEPQLVRAVAQVKDGAFAEAPVAEGPNFAVVWRRSTVAPTHRSLDTASPEIRATLFRERTEATERKLIDDLRAKNVRDVDASSLGLIVLPPFDAGVSVLHPLSTPAATQAK